jgi:hypothetical protein
VARYTFGAYELIGVSEKNFQQFVELVKGPSIVSLGDFGADRVELGLSGKITLRVLLTKSGIEINCFSTQNPEEPLAFTLALGEMPETIPVWQLDAKLRGLRTAFAIFNLLSSNRQDVLSEYLVHHPQGDIDRALLEDGETLEIESLSYGSWIASLRAKTTEALNAITALATLVYPRTRDAFLRKIEAEADLKETEAQRGTLALERERFALAKERADYVLDLANRIGDGEAKTILLGRLRTAIYELGTGDLVEDEIRRSANRLLPRGKKSKRRSKN